MLKAFITGLAGTTLTRDERDLIGASRPAGLILFARNVETGEQVRALVADFKAAVGTDQVLVLVDQEGGRVQRLRPPIATLLPPAAAYLAHHADDVGAAAHAARVVARLVAEELRGLGINTDCAPILDVPVAGAHGIIGNRAFANDPATVARLGRAFAEGLMAGGVLPVTKHIPGHGRARADSHLELPVVETARAALVATDFASFKALSDLPAAMTAHVVYAAIDPAAPASTSASVTRDVIRGHCGFDGLLMSDDLGMKALSGTFGARAQAVLAAGSDLALHCSGNIDEMRQVAAAVPVLAGPALARFKRALAVATAPPVDHDASEARRLCAALVAFVA